MVAPILDNALYGINRSCWYLFCTYLMPDMNINMDVYFVHTTHTAGSTPPGAWRQPTAGQQEGQGTHRPGRTTSDPRAHEERDHRVVFGQLVAGRGQLADVTRESVIGWGVQRDEGYQWWCQVAVVTRSVFNIWIIKRGVFKRFVARPWRRRDTRAWEYYK